VQLLLPMSVLKRCVTHQYGLIDGDVSLLSRVVSGCLLQLFLYCCRYMAPMNLSVLAVSFATEQLDHIICLCAVCDVMYLLLVSDQCCWIIDAAYHCAVGAAPALGVLCVPSTLCVTARMYVFGAALCARRVVQILNSL
jgi:hypothetical protein